MPLRAEPCATGKVVFRIVFNERQPLSAPQYPRQVLDFTLSEWSTVALQAGGRRFEPCTAHQLFSYTWLTFASGDALTPGGFTVDLWSISPPAGRQGPFDLRARFANPLTSQPVRPADS